MLSVSELSPSVLPSEKASFVVSATFSIPIYFAFQEQPDLNELPLISTLRKGSVVRIAPLLLILKLNISFMLCPKMLSRTNTQDHKYMT